MKGDVIVKGLLFGLILCSSSVFAFSWAPINPAELKMTEEPKAPGAAAIILDMTVDRDDAEFKITNYQRIKILTEDGRKYGDVEIPYEKGQQFIRFIEARTIQKDGTITEFNGKIFDKLLVKGKGIKYQAKTFAVPNIQIGSIVELRYVVDFDRDYVYDSQWILDDELFIKHAKYTLIPYPYYTMQYTWPRGLPPGVLPPINKSGKLTLETSDVVPFVSEDYMPPETELKHRVDFVYQDHDNDEKDPAKFWKKYSKTRAEKSERFMDQKKAMLRVLADLNIASESNEGKLRKIYAYVRSLRNLSAEKEMTEQEAKREKLKDRSDVEDVVKYGYGNGTELTYLFVALARAARFNADFVEISTRNKFFFQPGAMNPHNITSNVALVTIDGKERFFEPGLSYIPFGVLPWHETLVTGLKISKDGGGWIRTPTTLPSASKITRKATFKLNDDTLQGKVVVTYSGLSAIDQRMEQQFEDDAARKESMQSELKRAIPVGAEVSVTNSPDWEGVESPLVVEYAVKIPGWITAAGKRMLMPVALFGADDRHTFEHEQRIHPIYFQYPNIVEDDISIELPTTMQVASVPPSHDENINVLAFSSSADIAANSLHIKRSMTTNGVFLQEKFYLALRDLFQSVRTYDEEQIVLTVNSPPVKQPIKKPN